MSRRGRDCSLHASSMIPLRYIDRAAAPGAFALVGLCVAVVVRGRGPALRSSRAQSTRRFVAGSMRLSASAVPFLGLWGNSLLYQRKLVTKVMTVVYTMAKNPATMKTMSPTFAARLSATPQ